jgi:hypothetical protein
VDFGFGLLGEPLRGRMEPAVAHATLERHGFAVERDTGASDWAREHLRGRPSRLSVGERLIAAVKR